MKIAVYILLVVIAGFTLYKSVYIKKRGAVENSVQDKFDAAGFSAGLWNKQLPAKLDSAVELTTLIRALEANPAEGLSKYSNALAIGNYRYCLVRLQGTVAAINEDDMTLQMPYADSLLKIKLVTEYVYGNAIRDASKLVDIKDISDPAALNDISAALNKQVRTNVLPAFKQQVKRGQEVEVAGAIEINKEHIRFNALELVPVRIKSLP
jgi:predicted lipoprotein